MSSRQKTKQDSINNRKNCLIQALRDNKLEFKWYGDCYTYVMYDCPSLEEVINNELIRMHRKTKRKFKLASKLHKCNIVLDESLPSCYNYINNVGCKSLQEIVRDVEIEHFFKYKTDCDKLIKNSNMSLTEARDVSLKKYLESLSDSSNKVAQQMLNKKIIVKFD